MARDHDDETPFLRHTIATLAYRGGKVLRGAPPSFASFRAAPTTRTPVSILAHVGDLLDWACRLAEGDNVFEERTPGAWDEEVRRFFDGLARLDARLAAAPPSITPGAIFQGPVADALTHVGQIAMLRRMAGAPVRGENYFRAEIVAGRVGDEQAAPRREFE